MKTLYEAFQRGKRSLEDFLQSSVEVELWGFSHFDAHSSTRLGEKEVGEGVCSMFFEHPVFP